jgi:glycosyltransferase involved in cell wall biosynthesis
VPRIVVLWTGVTKPMADCWRALAALPGVDLTVFSELHRQTQTAYDESDLLTGVDHHLRYSDEHFDRDRFAEQVAALRPDAMIVLGWRSVMCRAGAESRRLAGIPKILAFDLQFAFTIRKLLAPVVLRPYLRRFCGAFVPGERSAAYARWLGFPDAKVTRGLTGLEVSAFQDAAAARGASSTFPKRFLYVGRYAREKGLDVLIEAYRRYRGSVAEPWSLTCCGIGPEVWRLKGVEGVEDRGFVQPAELPAVYAEHGAFVLASRDEPWGFVIQEAAASGLPIVCTSACGASVELVRDRFNGRVVAAGDAKGLAEGLVWIAENPECVQELGQRSLELIAPYSANNWAKHALSMCQQAASSSAY